jgi:hypothetical protein
MDYKDLPTDPSILSIIAGNKEEINLPPPIDGRDRFLTIQRTSAETISPLVKKSIGVDSIYEVIDRNFSYPLTAHVGLKFDSRTFANVPAREYDVKMKKVKVPSNYFPLGGNGLDRRYVYSNSNYEGNPTTLDLIFLIDQNMGFAARSLIKRNLREFLGKLISGYTNIRASIWQTSNDQKTIVNPSTNETINNFTYFDTDLFFELETPDSAGNNQTNLHKKLTDALAEDREISPEIDPAETAIANFFLRKSQFSITDEVGSQSEQKTLERIWKNTVRKVIYFSGSTPEIMQPSTYQILVNHARENSIQFYYFYSDAQFSGTRTLRELSDDSGGGSFNMQHDSDVKLQQFCTNNFYDSNRIYYGDWDGTFKIAWTDNPAWVLYDILTDVNYGLGNYIDIYSIDKWTLYDIGRYCDAVDDNGKFVGVPDGKGGLEPRYTCNIIFYNKDEAFKVVQEITTIFKGIIYWSTEGFSFFADTPKEPIMFFGNSNVKDGLFNYSEVAKNKRFTSIEVVYNDKYDDFKTKIELIEDPDGIRKFGLNPFRVNAAGCSSRSEARRIGRYVLFGSIFESDTVSFNAGLEAVYLQPGDIIGVSDEVRNVGKTFGRVLKTQVGARTVIGPPDIVYDKITIDGDFKDGLDPVIYVHIPSGSYSISDLNNLTGIDGNFSGKLEHIRARRQKQTKKYNIDTSLTDASDDYTNLFVRGEFLAVSAKTEVYPLAGRISAGGTATGETVLTGITYYFPEQTVFEGNPITDTVKYQNVVNVFTANDIDITFSGSAGTGQLISGLNTVANWTAIVSNQDGTVTVNGSSRGTQPSNGFSKIMALNPDGTLDTDSNLATSVITGSALQTFVDARNDGDIIIVTSRGSAFSNQENVASIFAKYGATEVYTIGKDKTSSANLHYGYCCAFIKGGYRIVERASKDLNDFGTLKFTHRDLAAFCKLRPFYTIMQADVGNRQESVFAEWRKETAYVVGNKIKVTTGGVSVPYVCTRSHTSSSSFSSDYDSSNSARSKWSLGNNGGYSTIGFPKDFYGTGKLYIDETLTASYVSSAFNAIGIDVWTGNGPFGQSDIAKLPESSGLGYSGLVYGTGFPRGFYDLTVDTNCKDVDKIPPGSFYVLSGSGVEPVLYKTISVKEEEANTYSVSAIEYHPNKEEFIEKDILNTSPSVYVQSPFDIVIKPNGVNLNSTGLVYSGSVPTGISLSWTQSTSPISGYKIYVSRPDYSTSFEGDAISEPYTIPSGTTSFTVPINGIWGQYDIDVYAQGLIYKFLSDSRANTGIMVLPSATLSGSGAGGLFAITSTIPTGFTVDTADTNSLTYKILNTAGVGVSGDGNGNFTSKNLTFRWKYIDPTGGIIDSVEKMLENPFVDLPPKVSIQVLDQAYQPLTPLMESYDRFSLTITERDNKILNSRERSNWENVEASRNLGLRVVVTDNTLQTKTGTFMAYNVKPSYSRIDVIDSYQNSPYYILSGYYGNSSYTGLAFWGSGVDGILGSGLRRLPSNNLLRSEDPNTEIMFSHISGAFKHATYIDGSTYKTGININYIGGGSNDYRAYVYSYSDLITNYEKWGKDTMIEVWGEEHYAEYGSGEGREIPKIAVNTLGMADLSEIPVNKTGFSGITFTVLTEEVSKGEIIFNCYSSFSNKDVLSVDVYTGVSGSFVADTIGKSNLYKYNPLYKTRSYMNQLRVSNDLETGTWHYFKFLPYDDFGSGYLSDVVSGYLEEIPIQRSYRQIEKTTFNGGRDENQEFVPTTASLTKDHKYQILDLGATINWTEIGCDTSPAVGVEFIYNGAEVSGSGGLVKRVEIKIPLGEENLNNTILADTASTSTITLPASVEEGSTASIINRGDKDIYIEDADGREISVIRPGERSDIIRADNDWYDPRGDSLYLER